MNKNSENIPAQKNDLDAFLDTAEKTIGKDAAKKTQAPGGNEHRKLRLEVSSDRMNAHFEAIFLDTTLTELQEALRLENIVSGLCKKDMTRALKKAQETGRAQRNVPAAKGKPAAYIQRREVTYSFLSNRQDPETRTPLHLAASLFRDVPTLMSSTDIEKIRAYNRPLIAVKLGTSLMTVQGEDVIEPGCDIYGKAVWRVNDSILPPLKAGDGVVSDSNGVLTADRFGYLAIREHMLMVISPIWISPDKMVAYFVNPPQIEPRMMPDKTDVLTLIKEEGITSGTDETAIENMCRDLASGHAREWCVPIAKGRAPNLSKGQYLLTFDPLPPARFEAVYNALHAIDLEKVIACTTPMQPVSTNTVLARQASQGNTTAPEEDIFGRPVASSEPVNQKAKLRAGAHVRREERDGYIYYLADLYGYAGILENQIKVIPSIWVDPDHMSVHFIALPQQGKPVLPSEAELAALLDQARIRHGQNEALIKELTHTWPDERAVEIAKGTPSKPGDHGHIELLFKSLPDPGKILESGSINFRERDSVPQANLGDLLATRSFPTPGEPGQDVRGRKLPPPKTTRGLLYAGPNVTTEEKEGQHYYYATKPGWPRVIKDTLGVMQRFVQHGNIDYTVGNLDIEGDVEIEGSVKSRFCVKATGDIYIGGAVEINAEVEAGGNVVVQRGIHNAHIKAGGDLYVRFVQDARIEIGGNLLVQNYIQNTNAQVGKKAIIQGNKGGHRQLCLLGGALVATEGIETTSVGNAHRRQTRVLIGLAPESEQTLERYRKGFAFSNLQARKGMRVLTNLMGSDQITGAQIENLGNIPIKKRALLLKHLQELNAIKQMRSSIEYHILELEKERKETLERVQIRVTGTCFRETTIQIGQVYETIARDENALVYQLNPAGTEIARIPLQTAKPIK